MNVYAIAFLCVIVLTLLLFRGAFAQTDGRPPGPKGLPILGNIHQVPTIKTWRYFESLWHSYGTIFRLSMAGDEMLVLSDPHDAEELLGRRSYNYSSRPPLVYAGYYQSNNKRLVLLQYGEALKRQRAAFHQMLQPRVVGAYETIQEIESAKLLHDMLVRPEDSTRHCQRFAASLVFHLSYGQRLEDDDEDLKAVNSILENFVRDTYPGAHMVDSLPMLDKLPAFLAPWRKEARQKHNYEMKLYQRLVLEVKQKMDHSNVGIECFAARLWEQKDKLSLDLEELSYVAGSAFEAGTDTTTATMQWFLMAALLFPQALSKAQAEIDGLLGSDGSVMPTFEHINKLPYCVAMTKEIFRWAPPAPGGFPHYSDVDDTYKGYKLKARTMVVPCIWNMHHNESEFPKHSTFDPDRFLKSEPSIEHDPLTDGHYAFGFGRRKCPGLHLASKSIWIGVTRLAWGFKISPQYDKKGVPLPVSQDNCTSGMTSRPCDFPFTISPRSENHAQTIKKQWALNK